ncbi:hypothetical protein CHS0354_028165 [Potamilus streckersoni]|uniref:Uncharacterized protein n=1 Tax=Potamilus streckersoni TaxID=2493646 RepID=A0AAE0TID2_9BIVA|nr:hypothetical protein CHS0354_028165 [Potamilus streckersoni]
MAKKKTPDDKMKEHEVRKKSGETRQDGTMTRPPEWEKWKQDMIRKKSTLKRDQREVNIIARIIDVEWKHHRPCIMDINRNVIQRKEGKNTGLNSLARS